MKIRLTGSVNSSYCGIGVNLTMIEKEYDLTHWPEGQLEYMGHCPMCGSEDRALLHDGLIDNLFFCAPGKWALHKCQKCAAAFVDPRPSIDSIYLAYRNYYTHESSSESVPERMRLPQKISRSLGNGYRNWRYGTNLRPSSLIGVAVVHMLPQIKRAIDVQFRCLSASSTGKRVLDVGFRGGVFLKYASSVGWDVAGADIDAVVIKNAKAHGIDARQGSIEAFADEVESFDYITISHVIEHVYDPVATLRMAYKLLKPGGLLWVDTPNIDSYGYAHYGENWLGVDAPRHLVIFGWDTMTYALKEAGFHDWKYVDRAHEALAVFPLSEQVRIHSRTKTNPFSEPPSKPAWVARMAAFKSKVFKRHAEFITVIAVKP